MGTECSPDGTKSSSEGPSRSGLGVHARGLIQILAEVLQCQMLSFLLAQNNSSECEVQGGPGRRKRRMSSRQRGPRQLPGQSLSCCLLLPWSSSCLDGRRGMTGAWPFQARVPGDLASKGILQPSTLSK